MPDTPRAIRIFVSSTFRDMGAERDRLAKFVFPALHRLCEERGVGFADVDLRWGITDEESAEGRVLPICLEEIEGCRPYFIGVLGERYGWVPEGIPDELIETQPWLAEHLKKSVTELEIIHGVLRAPEMVDRCFFYFRDPTYAESAPEDQRADFISEDEASRRKLEALKERIRRSGLPLREGYPDPQELAALVEADMRAVIEDIFPPTTVPDPLVRERSTHESYARPRRALYIGRKSYFDRLDTHAASDDGPLVITGMSGGGKSALVANWIENRRAVVPNVPIVVHYTGASASSADWLSMCRRVAAELSRVTETPFDLPETDAPVETRAKFIDSLFRVASTSRAVLVIDGLNQLEDREGALDLAWLPYALPPGLRIVLTVLPGRPLDEARRRGWHEFAVDPLDAAERERLIKEYLSTYRKQLPTVELRRIAEAPQCANPLFLRTLLEELRLWGAHETLRDAIADYLSVTTVGNLFEKVLARWEVDYERSRPGLVRDAMVALWAARRGLDETELLAVLGEEGTALPRARFSPLYLAAEAALLPRSGLLGFAHDFIRQAVSDRYLPEVADHVAAHALLARHFATQERTRPRVVDELPWLYQQAGMWNELATLVGDLGFLKAVRTADKYDQTRYWAALEVAGFEAPTVYADVLARPDAYDTKVLDPLARLLRGLGYSREAERLRAHIVERLRRDGDPKRLQSAINKLALLRKAFGDSDSARDLFLEAEGICRATGNSVGLQAALNNRALILTNRARFDEAMLLLQESEVICRRLGRRESLESSLFNQASIHRRRGGLEIAGKLLDEAERISREVASPGRIRNVLAAKAAMARMRGDLDAALTLHAERERSCRELGAAAGTVGVLNDTALVRLDREEYAEAAALLDEAQVICNKLGLPARTQTMLGTRARLLRETGNLSGALALLADREELVRGMQTPTTLVETLVERADAQVEAGELDAARVALDEAALIVAELTTTRGKYLLLGAQAALAEASGERELALDSVREQESLLRGIGSVRLLGVCLEAQARLLHCIGRAGQGMSAAQEAYEIAAMLRSPQAMARRAGLVG
jgi:tetratricopeptide (TPR) repeat protein